LAARSLATERALAAANQRYYERVFFADISPPTVGELCAFDLDGVLETRWHDFPAITPAGALALRALNRHGFRPVLATGRSLREVQLRCAAYRLAGGVAEYGTVVYDHTRGETLPQVTPSEEADLRRLREILRETPGVYIDEQHGHSVRAMRWNDRGGHRGLTTETIAAALAEAEVEPLVQVMSGRFQTDFVPASTDKGRALAVLAEVLAASDSKDPLAFAIGDDWPDMTMLALARRPFAPANMGQVLQQELRASSGLSVTRDTRGEGVLQAVSSFVGHDPRRCRTCRPPEFSANRELVVTMLAGSDGPRRARIRQTAALTWQLGRVAARTRVSVGRGR
jgi:hydroxymethylpyrimidine pyrophosphatase-like HAD family hydrolase